MSKSPPRSYFEREPETNMLDEDARTRRLSAGKIGVYAGKYVNLDTRRYISENYANRIMAAEAHRLANHPLFNHRGPFSIYKKLGITPRNHI